MIKDCCRLLQWYINILNYLECDTFSTSELNKQQLNTLSHFSDICSVSCLGAGKQSIIAKDTQMDPAAQDLLQVMDWGQFWIPWYQPCWWDAFGPCLGLDVQLWPLLPLPFFSPTTAIKLVSGTKRPFLLFPRGVSLAGGAFYVFFFPEYFFLPWGYTGEWNCSVSPSQHPGKVTSDQNSCGWCSFYKARYYGVSLGFKINKYIPFVLKKYYSITNLLESIQAEAKTLCISLGSIN